MERPLLVIFLGPSGPTPEEELVDGARRAAALDALDMAMATGAYERALLLTPSPDALGPLPKGVEVVVDEGPFHFGRRLQEVVARLKPPSLVYIGGGALPLLSLEEWAAVAMALARQEGVVTNNLHSSDLVAVRPAHAILSIEPPARDNALARLLAGVGLPTWEMPRTLSTTFDLDTPADVAILKLTGYAPGPRLQRWAREVPLELGRYQALLPVLTDPQAQLFVAGRVGSHVWRFLEEGTACRVRLLAEERGLQALGLRARSLLGMMAEALGEEGLARALALLGDAAVVDTRVLMSHLGMDPSRRDRFLSDLGRPHEIGEPRLRRLTHALISAPVPVLLGGHSLVTGGIMALARFAWEVRDRGMGLR